MSHFELSLLGGFELRRRSGAVIRLPTRKAEALLAHLALAPEGKRSRDRLAGLLWSGSPEDSARGSLRQTLWLVGKALDGNALSNEGRSVVLPSDALVHDVSEFERCCTRSDCASLERAAALYRGDLLAGLVIGEASFEEWLLTERERLRESAIDALARLVALQREHGDTEQAVQTALRLLALDPLEEISHRTLMRLYAAQGRRGAALRHYQSCVAVLRRELGVEPEPETRQLYQEILRGRPAERAQADDGPARDARLDAEVAPPETPLVGRERVREQLEGALAEVRNGRGRVVAIVGEAGIGKTRLAEELAAMALEGGARVAFGRCFESAQILPLAPWSVLLRAVLAGESLEALQPVWRAELARLLPEAGRPDLPAPSDDALRLFDSIARCLRDLASRQPLVLAIEDLHWADDLSMRLLAFLVRRLADAPVLMLGTAREEELASVPAVRGLLGELTSQPNAVNLQLPTLSKDETAVLVRALTGGRRDKTEVDRLAAQIWTGSQGNPLVVVETMHALGKDPVPETLPVPERVQQLIAERLARLGASPQELVAVAATIGGEFDFELLRQASGLAEQDAVESLEELVRHRVLQSVGERFDFTHERVREVAYARLLPPRRRLLHAQVAAALEQLNSADPARCAAALGRHYCECQAWDKAWRYLRQAGTQAAAHAAHREAAECYERALGALEHLPEDDAMLGHAIDLRFDLRSSLFTLAEHSRIAEHLREAETLATRLGDQRRLGWVLRYACNYSWISGNLAQALEIGQRGLAIAESLGDVGLRVAIGFCTAQVHYARGAYGSGIELLAATAALLDGPRLHERFSFHSPPSILARTWLAYCLAETGAFSEGIAAGEEAMRIAESVEHPEAKVSARMGLAQVLIRRGEAARALPLLEEARSIGKSRELRVWLRPIAMSLGVAYCMLGRLDEAIALLEPGGWRTRAYAAERATFLAQAYLPAGRIDEAAELAAQAVDWARKSGERGREAWALRFLAEAESRRCGKNVASAERHRREALALALELGMRPLAAQLGTTLVPA